MSTGNKLSTQETIATVISAAIILTIVVYWIVQIKGVMEMLKMAYG